jgi:DNA repair photolyase
MKNLETYGRDPITSPEIRPLEFWELTGLVALGEVGPGCPVACIYCNQMGMDKGETGEKLAPYISFTVDGGISLNSRLMVGSKIERTIGIKPLVAELKKNPFYSQISPIFLENFNDPGNDWNHTANLIEEVINELDHQGPFVFITKMGIKPEHVTKLVELQQNRQAKIIGIVTYSGMPKRVENSSDTIRTGTLRKLHEAGIPTILSMRPLIKDINDSPENIKRVLEETRGITDAVICGGLFVFDEFTVDNFEKAGYSLANEYKQDIYSLAKSMPVDYKPIVREIAESINYPAVVHSHTTCAVTDLTTRKYNRKKPDRFPHWFNHNAPAFSDCGHCPAVQKKECQKAANTPYDVVADRARTALDHIGYSHLGVEEAHAVSKLLLIKDGSLAYEELAYIREQTGWYTDNLPSREGFLGRAKPAIERDMTFNGIKYKYEDVIAGEFLVDQEWQVIFKMDDDRLNNYALRWLRSRVRNRIQGISIKELTATESAISNHAERLAAKSYGQHITEEIQILLNKIVH